MAQHVKLAVLSDDVAVDTETLVYNKAANRWDPEESRTAEFAADIAELQSRSGTYATRAEVDIIKGRLDVGVSVSDAATAAMIDSPASATHQAVAQIAAEANAGIVQHPQHPGLYQIVTVP